MSVVGWAGIIFSGPGLLDGLQAKRFNGFEHVRYMA